ncbi:SDR family NAD(P)-dependent oxidoreductase [Rhizorhabdus histidinilytica]|uniref:NAD(P)-dependent dehydrogenase, short-chain alcohol dehydrogenase family n=1 Tax=Rhizorhabdus histidinilytica TaxID=439228 RepID=A0A1T5GUH2_9SPHN|nr:glucose 1-dehydrogenase [Rhizorhabdus histidinilytica]SKC11970.1 NAD(P)-dependent dehydrogenase, short-chain alcohol dehydrogenase family [Rhizorhabdus histidinilytica]
MRGLSGKSYIVTGGGSGVGRATARRLAEFGCKVTIADRSEDTAREAVEMITKAGGVAHAIRTDLSLENEVKAMVDSAVNSYGRLDGAVNAAGTPQRGKATHELSTEEWDFCHGVNLRGLFFCNKYEILAMLQTGGGAIVNIASTLSSVAVANSAEYSASKAGVMGLVRGAALDYGTKGIRVNAVLPGLIDTPMLQTALNGDPNLEEALYAACPMKRMSQPEEQASAACFLLSDEASFITGAGLPVDGGMLAI